MTSTFPSASRLPAAFSRAAIVDAPGARPTGTGPRHLAADLPGVVRIATPEDLLRRGRHAETEWSRELHDPERDEADSLSWLGFAPRR